MAPPQQQQRSLSLAGAWIVAGQLRDAAARRHELAVERVGQSRACPFDLHALVPDPREILRRGPDDPVSLAWLWAHWGTTCRNYVTSSRKPRTRARRDGAKPMRGRGHAAPTFLVGRLVGLARADADGAGSCASICDPADSVTTTPRTWRRLRTGRIRPVSRDLTRRPCCRLTASPNPFRCTGNGAREKINLARLSIGALIAQFADALAAALTGRDTRQLDRWAGWTVMAAALTELWSRLLLPADAAASQVAEAEAEALRRQLLARARMRQAADWLGRRLRSVDVFARGMPEASVSGRGSDLTDLLRACLVALRVPDTRAAAYRPRPPPLWRVRDAAPAQVARHLADDTKLAALLLAIAGDDPGRTLRCRAAVASTLVAGLELAATAIWRSTQDAAWTDIRHAARPIKAAGLAEVSVLVGLRLVGPDYDHHGVHNPGIDRTGRDAGDACATRRSRGRQSMPAVPLAKRRAPPIHRAPDQPQRRRCDERPMFTCPPAGFPCSRHVRCFEEEAAATRAAIDQGGEFAAAVELRRRFPGIADNAHARTCAEAIADWQPPALPLRRALRPVKRGK